MHAEMPALTESSVSDEATEAHHEDVDDAVRPTQSAQWPAQQHHGSNDQLAERLAGARAALREAADEAAAAALSQRTRALYASDWARFSGWCEQIGLCPLPAEVDTIAMYVMDMSMTTTARGGQAFKVSTIERHLAAIARHHTEAGHHPSPTSTKPVSQVLQGIKRQREGERPARMRPLLLGDVKTVLEHMDYTTWPAGVSATRDAFVLLAGFAGAFRRSELASLTHGDLTWSIDDGLHVFLPASKTDQEGAGATIGLPYGKHPGSCVVCAYVRWTWLTLAADRGRQEAMRQVLANPPWEQWQHICRDPAPEVEPSMPLLRGIVRNGKLSESGVSGDALHAAVKRRAAAAGYHQQIGFHSLRAGFVTQARRNGADPRAIRRQTRHESDAMVNVYDREYLPLVGNAVVKLGL